MIGGRSSSNGILIYDGDKKGINCVYGYYDDHDEIVLVTGTHDDMENRMVRDEIRTSAFKKIDVSFRAPFLLLAAVVWRAYAVGSALQFWVTLVYALVSYRSMVTLFGVFFNDYKSREKRRQLRRFHGCEHAIIRYYEKQAAHDPVWDPDRIRRYSIFSADCGTAHAGYTLCFLTVAAWLACQFPVLGLWKAAGMLLRSVIVLLVLYLIPMNPFKLLEIPIVAKPKERELRLGIAILERFSELEQSAC